MKLAEDVWGQREQNKPLLNVLRRYTLAHPDDKEGALRFAKVQLASGNSTEVGLGMESLWKLASADDAIGLQTLEYIDSLPSLTPEETTRLIDRLKNHPKADDTHYVRALKREVQQSPGHKKEIVMAATAKYRDKKRDALLPFIRWLVEEGEFRQVLSVLPENEAKAILACWKTTSTPSRCCSVLMTWSASSTIPRSPKCLIPQRWRCFERTWLTF